MFGGDEYNNIIWGIFALAVAFSFSALYILWNNPPQSKEMMSSILYFGFMILAYAALLVEGFGRKKAYLLNHPNNNNDFHNSHYSGYISAKYIAEIFIGLPLITVYILTSINLGFEFMAFSMFLVFTSIFSDWVTRRLNVDEYLLRGFFWAFSIVLLIAFIQTIFPILN